MAAAALVVAPLVAVGSSAAAADPVVVYDVDFDDATTGGWTQSGGVGLAYVDVDGGKALEVSDRSADYEGIESPAFTTVAGATYTFSLRAKLPDAAEGTADLRFVVKPEFAWVGNATITADAWTTVTGTWTAPDAASRSVYLGTSDLDPAAPYTYLVDDLLVTMVAPDGPPAGDGTSLTFDFEDGTTQGWAPRASADGPATVTVTETGGHESDRALQVSDRVHQGQGVQLDVGEVLTPGTPYEFEAWLRFDGEPGDMSLMARTRVAGSDADVYSPLVTITGVTEEWTRVAGTFSLPAFEGPAEIYLETAWANDAAGNTSTFLVDDISLTSPEFTVEDLTPLKDTVPFRMGVAIDDRETRGPQRELMTRHFNQMTAENHMKPDAWYDAEGNFRTHPQARTMMDTAAAEGMRMYGHVLVWHSQNPGQTEYNEETGAPATPGSFFYGTDGELLTSDPADQALLRERLRTHVFSVAETLADEYGLFGSDTNPLVAWDVVNEVVSDSPDTPGGLRTSAWFNVLGEEFIELAFRYADEAFNEQYAAPGTDRPVALFINDYLTEDTAKQGRYFALVERLLGRGVPLDGVGHQFHVSLTRSVDDLRAAIERFEALPVQQAVTELDVVTGTPVTEANLIEQGYYYEDAFALFREKADVLYSVTVWGLTDGRSWVNAQGAPLLFDSTLTAKPAYYGAAGLDLPAPIPTANVFRGEVPLDDDALTAVEWIQLRPHLLGAEGESGAFQLRWSPDTLTVLVEVAGDAPGVDIRVDDATYAFQRDGSGDVEGVVEEIDGGWAAVVHVPLEGATEGSTPRFNLVVQGGGGWTAPQGTGILTLVEELSYLEVPYADAGAPEIDGEIDEAWQALPAVVTGKQASGTGTATAEVRTMWDTNRLFVLMEITDPDIDLSAAVPWENDSVEIYVDAGNNKNGGYLPTDMQLRIRADNGVSFGAGDTDAQAARVTSATALTDGGYVVEAVIDMFDVGGPDSVHGLDFQVNDASGGTRLGTTNWADATNQGYQSTAHWGVGRFVEGPVEGGDPSISLGSSQVRPGDELQVALSGFEPGSEVAVALGSGVTAAGAVGGTGAAVAPEGTTLLGTVQVGDGGTGVATVTIPADTVPGTYLVSAAVDGDVLADAVLTVLAAAPGDGSGGGTGDGGTDAGAGAGSGTGTGSGGGKLAVTGTDLGLAALALLVIAAGVALVVARRRGTNLAVVAQTLLRR